MGRRRKLTNEQVATKIEKCVKEVRSELNLTSDSSDISVRKLSDETKEKINKLIKDHKVKTSLVCMILNLDRETFSVSKKVFYGEE